MIKNFIRRIYNRIINGLRKFSYCLFNPREFLKHEKNFCFSKKRIYFLASERRKFGEENTYSCVIFSKDRPVQLNALLESYKKFVKNPATLYIIYNYSSESFKKAYDEVFDDYDDLIEEKVRDDKGFKATLVGVLKSIKSQKIFFLVDDILFKNYLNLDECNKFPTYEYVISLRHGNHLDYCYTQKKKQKLPKFFNIEEGEYLFWNWNKAQLDWSYPLSVDGHIFDKEEFLIMIECQNYKAPNTLEEMLQKFNKIYLKRKGVCWKNSRIFNIPCNLVQTEAYNHHGDFHQDDLLKKWNEGKKIDIVSFEGIRNNGVHQEVSFNFVKRM